MEHRLRALGGVLLVLAGLALGCAAEAPKRAEKSGAVTQSWDGAFPPTGPVTLLVTEPPLDGTLYQLLSSYEGRTELLDEGRPDDEAQAIQEFWTLELDYRALPVQAPETERVTSLVLEALKRKAESVPPGGDHVVEIGDDRLRVSAKDKVSVDLRGAQPKEDLTPRSILQKSFAMLVTDPFGNPKTVTLRGVPSAKKLLAGALVREPIAYVQIGLPEHPVSAGDTWHEKRFFPNPVGRLGLAADIELRLVGFEEVDGAPCARVALRSAMDSKEAKSESGFKFDEVRFSLNGDAWIDLRNGQTVQARIEDVSAVMHHRSGGTMIPARVRMRYTSRSVLHRLDELPASTTWADGSKRFSAVK